MAINTKDLSKELADKLAMNYVIDVDAMDGFEEIFDKVLTRFYVYKTPMEEENMRLKEEIKRLKTMIDYQPGGSGYVEAKENFDSLAKESTKK